MGEQIERRIDRAAIERIIQRAAELQTGEHEIGDGLTPEQVLALAKEVGIPETHVRRAILEESMRQATDPPRSGALDKFVGPGTVEVSRVVPGDVATVERLLLTWMSQHEILAVQRQQPGRIAWEPLSGMQAAIRRGSAVFGSTSKPFMLAKAERVTATIMALEPGWCQVSLTAELQRNRSSMLVGAGVFGVTGVIGTTILWTLGAFLPVVFAPLPVAAAAAWAMLRTHPPVAARTQLGLERALDHLEQAKPPAQLPSSDPAKMIGAVISEVRKALQ
jgi:hypothetical protein